MEDEPFLFRAPSFGSRHFTEFSGSLKYFRALIRQVGAMLHGFED